MSESPDQAPRDDNPFSSAAVATPREFDDSTVSIETRAITEAFSVVDDFLNQSARSSGTVLAIDGEYGTGKSHLLGAVLHHMHRSGGGLPPKCVYLEAKSGTFVDLYRHLVGEELTRDGVTACVREFYADVVADALKGSKFTAETAERLRSGELDPVEVSDRMSLMESRHLDRLRRLLENVTKKAVFGVVLPLLLRPQFADAAWEWLSGHQPDEVLVDRGVDTPIDTEELALEAMGVLALLYSQRGRQFILAIDEMNRVVSATRKPSGDAVDAFQKLLEVFTGARALLILAGLPEYLEELGEGVRQRIRKIVRVSALTGNDVIEYIRRCQERVGRGAVMQPFDEDVARYLVKINNGNARQVIRLCADLYRRAMDGSPGDPGGAVVTLAMVRSVAREQTGASTVDHVRNEIRQVFNELGLGYRRDHVLDSNVADARADYWVPYGSVDGAGCVVLVMDNVLTETEREMVRDRSMHIHAVVERVDVVLVVVGLLHSDHLPQLNTALSVEPIVYDHWTFRETLTSVLERQLSQVGYDESSAKLDERFGRLGRQQANTQRMLELTLKALSMLRTESDRSLTHLQRDVIELGEAVRAGEEAVAPLRLPPSVLTLFTTAQSSLEGVDQVDATVRAMFAAAGEAGRASAARSAVRARLRSPNLFPAIGVAATLRVLLAAFRDGVNEWYRSYVPGPTGQLHDADADKLTDLCRAFENSYEYVPFFRLEDLARFTPRLVDDSLVLESDLVGTREMFNRLSTQVRAAVLESVVDGR